MALDNTFVPDNLESALLPKITIPVTVLSGQSVIRGQAVSVSGGKVSALLTTVAFYGVMNETVDASAGDVVGSMIYTGAVLGSEVTFTTGDQAEFQEAARAAGIILL